MNYLEIEKGFRRTSFGGQVQVYFNVAECSLRREIFQPGLLLDLVYALCPLMFSYQIANWEPICFVRKLSGYNPKL